MQIDCHSNTQDGFPHVDTRWPPQDGQQGRAVGRDQAYKGEQLGATRPAGEGSWGNRACRGGQWGEIRAAGELLGIHQGGRGMFRG